MVNTESSHIRMAKDGWTALAVDGKYSAHFEHTVLVDEEKPEILTLPEGSVDSATFLEQKLSEIGDLVTR